MSVCSSPLFLLDSSSLPVFNFSVSDQENCERYFPSGSLFTRFKPVHQLHFSKCKGRDRLKSARKLTQATNAASRSVLGPGYYIQMTAKNTGALRNYQKQTRCSLCRWSWSRENELRSRKRNVEEPN